MLAGRVLSQAEIGQLSASGGQALPGLIRSWVNEPGFEKAARLMVSLKLRASGKRGDLDLDLPGNLAAYLVRHRLPYALILKADYCVDANLEKVPCDTGASYAAGVLATRAYLSNNASRFNLKRARTMVRTFACLDYPIDQAVQTSLSRDELISLFQQDKVETDDGSGSFGNGFACFTCHSQFGAHAQPFVKFDADGLWQKDATGLQLEGGEQGRSDGKLFASHMLRPEAASSEASQVFGKRVANLSEAGAAIAEHELFAPCAARSLVGFAFGLPDSVVNDIPAAILAEVTTRARAEEAEPTLGTLAVHTFSHPSVVRSFRP
jgi:hypothetical protein